MWQLILLIFILFPSSNDVKKRVVNQQKVIRQHNKYRKEVGVEDLKYSKECADFAQKWAERLALKNSGLRHSSSRKFGENIYWYSKTATESDVVDYWAIEKKYFNKKTRKYTSKAGHYSQMVWRNTKFVGTGMAIANDGSEFWVCTYYPAGNFIGKKAY